MSFTRGQWAQDFLGAIGNPLASKNALYFVCGWSFFETGANLNSGARYNLLNTTQPASGATNFNSVGVKHYTSYSQGVNANAATLKNGLYPNLLKALQSSNDSLLANPNSAMIAELNKWGTGYKINFVQSGQSHLNDVANYGSNGNVEAASFPTPTDASSTPTPSPLDSIASTLSGLQSVLDPMFLAKMGIGVVMVALGLYFLIKGVMPSVKIK